jgi:hypothetical protein
LTRQILQKDFKTILAKKNEPSGKNKFKLELGHKIALVSLFIALLVFLFGNNIMGRFYSGDSQSEVDADTINSVKSERIIDTLNLPYLETVPILDKGLFIKYYFNDLVLGGANIDTVRINMRTKTGESLKMTSSNNQINLDINTEPYIEIEYKKKFYSFETTGRHYEFTCIIKEINTPTLQLRKP